MTWQSAGCGVTGPGFLPMSDSCKLGDPGRVSHSSGCYEKQSPAPSQWRGCANHQLQHTCEEGESLCCLLESGKWDSGTSGLPAGYSGDDMFRETTFLRSAKCSRQLAHYGLQGCKLTRVYGHQASGTKGALTHESVLSCLKCSDLFSSG